LDHAISLIIFAILTLAGLVMDFIGYVDGFLAAVLNSAHVPPNAQIILLAVVAVALVVLAIRMLGRIFAALVVVLLVLILVRQTFPKMEVPQAHLPSALHLPAGPGTNI
jgi:F0F1-type ATP synthase membrane subunit a